MRLLIIECGNSKLPAAITTVALAMRPKPELVSTMTVTVDRLQPAEFKYMVYHLTPDTIILNPSDQVETSPNWIYILRELVRHTQVTGGKLLFVSSVEVLGDVYQRTEDAIEMPCSEYGMFLQPSETEIEESPSHFIVRLPYTTENKKVLEWVKSASQSDGREVIHDNQLFTLISIPDAAKAIIDRIETGLYGKYHVTPGDKLALSNLVALEIPTTRIPDQSLLSKYRWQVEPSGVTWSHLVQED